MSRAAQWLNMGMVSVLAGSWPVDVRYAESWFPRFLERWIDRPQPKAIAFREALREDKSIYALGQTEEAKMSETLRTEA